MKLANPYLRLMRLHQPVGIWLLFWPCAWSLVLAAGHLDVPKLLLFFIGAVLMRGAGCIINDMVDRDIDKQVERTKTRPLASGELQVNQALGALVILLVISAWVAFALGLSVVMWGVLALLPVVAYPYMKRISWWPQLFLGLVFNWGAFMGWASVRDSIGMPAILLYVGGILLTLGYDTIYALQDKADDTKIGVRSTALRLGADIKKYVSLFYAGAIFCFACAMASLWGALALIPAALHCAWQVSKLDISRPESAKTIFFSNIWLELLIFLAIYISVLFP